MVPLPEFCPTVEVKHGTTCDVKRCSPSKQEGCFWLFRRDGRSREECFLFCTHCGRHVAASSHISSISGGWCDLAAVIGFIVVSDVDAVIFVAVAVRCMCCRPSVGGLHLFTEKINRQCMALLTINQRQPIIPKQPLHSRTHSISLCPPLGIFATYNFHSLAGLCRLHFLTGHIG